MTRPVLKSAEKSSTSADRYPVAESSSGAAAELELDHLASRLEESLAAGDLAPFYDALRASELAFVSVTLAAQPLALARCCCDLLHRLGGISPAVALALENHLYVSSALATFPLSAPHAESRRHATLERLLRERLLVANTNSRVHGDRLGAFGTAARRVSGGLQVSGQAAYMSLALQGDLLFFLTLIENEGPALCMIPMRGNPALEIGPFLFPNAMIDSDTRRVTFHDLVVADDDVLLAGNNEEMLHLVRFELVWHQLLIPALYLGAAARAIDEARRFLRGVAGADGKPLADLDGMIADLGRLVMRHRAGWALVQQTADVLGDLARRPLAKAALEDLFKLAGTAKYIGTCEAEAVVLAARRIIGARGFVGGQTIERLSQEVMFGPLGPDVNAAIERRIGKAALSEFPFPDPGGSWLTHVLS